MPEKKKEALDRIRQSEQRHLQRQIEMEYSGDASLASMRNFDAYIDFIGDSDDIRDNQRRFLMEFAKDGLVGYAAMRAQVAPRCYYDWCKNPRFKELAVEAQKIANERLEKLAIDMASGVFTKPVVSAGQLVTTEEIRDTKMLAMLLKARMPERYAQKVDITSGGHSLVKLVDKEAWDSV